MGKITSIVYKPQNLPSKPEDHYTRVPLENAQLVAGYGIEGDAKGGHPARQVNIMSAESLEGLSTTGFNIEPGQMGEQMVVRGFDVDALEIGDRVKLGADAVIEVTSMRTGCDRFEALQGKLRTDAAGQMGVMAKVITGGAIKVGDSVMAV